MPATSSRTTHRAVETIASRDPRPRRDGGVVPLRSPGKPHARRGAVRMGNGRPTCSPTATGQPHVRAGPWYVQADASLRERLSDDSAFSGTPAELRRGRRDVARRTGTGACGREGRTALQRPAARCAGRPASACVGSGARRCGRPKVARRGGTAVRRQTPGHGGAMRGRALGDGTTFATPGGPRLSPWSLHPLPHGQSRCGCDERLQDARSAAAARGLIGRLRRGPTDGTRASARGDANNAAARGRRPGLCREKVMVERVPRELRAAGAPELGLDVRAV